MPLPLGVTRAELVELVKLVLGDVEAVKEARWHSLQLQPSARSLRLTFTIVPGMHLGTYLVPIPPEVLAAIADRDQRNPYNSGEVRIDVDLAEPTTVPEPAPAPPQS